MKNYKKPVILLLLFMIFIPACMLGKFDKKYSGNEQKNLVWHEGQRILVEEISGDIKVQAGSGNEVTIQGLKTVSSPSIARSRLEIKRLTMEVTSHRDEIKIVTCRPRNWGRISAWIDYTITAPASAPVVLKNVSGDVEVRKINNTVKAASVSGDVNLEEIGGDAEVRSVSGKVSIKNCSNSLLAETVSGDLLYGGTEFYAEQLAFKTISGDVKITLPSGFSGKVRVVTVSGNITSNLPLQIVAKPGKKLLEGTLGEGKTELTVSSVSGDVDISSEK